MSVRQARTYSNPFWAGAFPDPFVLKVRGRYYAYATEQISSPPAGAWVFSVLTSKDLVEWHQVGKAMPALGQPYCRYWAPEVTEYNGQFLLYYAVHTREFRGGIRVAVADDPRGPFSDSGHDLTGHLLPWAIDPHVFRDQDGQWYLYMTIEYHDDPAGLIGSGNAVARLIDPFTLEGNITRVTPPQHAWQLFEARRKERGGVDWYTVEGPTVTRHRGRYYEMFSGGCYYRDNYAVSYAMADVPMGTGGMRDTSWHDWEGSLLICGDRQQVISPGHNSLVLGPDNAEQYLVYHAWQQDRSMRRPYLDRLFWHGDVLWTAAPTQTPQPAPSLPRFRDLFDEPVLHPSWQQRGGYWRIAEEGVRQEDEAAEQAQLLQPAHLGPAWLLEVNLRRVGGQGGYGVLLREQDTTTLRITITPDLHLALWSARTEPLRTVALPNNSLAGAWHQLLISLSGSFLVVHFDGHSLLETTLRRPAHHFALLTEHCSAAFSGISLTDHFRDEFQDEHHTPALLGWEAVAPADEGRKAIPASDWRVRAGALEQMSSARGEHILLKGAMIEQYEFGATMCLQKMRRDGSEAAGLVVWSGEAGAIFVWLRQKQHTGCVLSVERDSEPAGTGVTLDLPATFDASRWHSLRVVYQGDRFTLYLDGPQVLTLPAPAGPGRPGLATRHVAAAFTSAWQTGLSDARVQESKEK